MFVENYLSNYDYVPFKNGWYVNCRAKKRLLKNGKVDKDVLKNMSINELQSIVNPRNVDLVEQIINEKVNQQKRLLAQHDKQRKEYNQLVEKCRNRIKQKNKIIDVAQRIAIYGC